MMGLMSAVPPRTQEDYPEDDPQGAMQLALEQLRRQFPRETSGARVRPTNWLERAILPEGVEASTYPWGTIAYNPALIRRSQPEVRDLLSHELTHVGQFQRMPIWQKALYPFIPPVRERVPYYQRPMEKEAFATSERQRAARRDIRLPDTGY